MNKNEIFETVITDISDTGLGIGHVENRAVFVKNAVVGDRLKVKITKVQKNIAFAIIDEITEASKHRIKSDCPHFPVCGGCALRTTDYAFELSLKQNGVYETMRRIGGIDKKPNDIISAENSHYRNKAQFPIGEAGAGFYAVHSHRVVPCDGCRLLPAEFSLAAEEFSRYLKENNIPAFDEQTKRGLVRHLFLRKGYDSHEVQAAVVINGDNIPEEEKLIETFSRVFGENLKSVLLNINRKDTNVILGDKSILLFGEPFITDTLCGVKVRLSLNSFYQVNHAAAELLYKKAAEYAAPEGKTILDLYCGAGTIGLSMANAAKQIIGVEIVPAAVEDAIHNARLNGIKNARFICGDAARAAKMLKQEGITADVVILDPPRKGCDKDLLLTIANGFCPQKIVYVSCDKATLARDVKVLSEMGYNLIEYTPVDMFPRTAHVETVVLITR